LAGCATPQQTSTGAILPERAADAGAQPAGADVQPAGIVQIPGAPDSPGVIGSDGRGNEWFAECESTIATIDESTKKFSQFNTSAAQSCGGGVALGRDGGGMWFTDYFDGKVGFIDLKSHVFHVYQIPTSNSYPVAIAAGPDNAMWFTESAAGPHGNGHGKIGRVDLSVHPYKITEYKLPYYGGMGTPYEITLGSDGALWFTDEHNDGIGRITTSHQIAFYPVPDTPEPFGITSGADKALWFTAILSGQIGRMDTAGNVSLFGTQNIYAQPVLITKHDSDLWFTEQEADRIGCINSTSHAIHRYAVPRGSSPYGISFGSDGKLWFTEPGTNSLGTLVPPDPCRG
ncbi:MAG: hypothetical protein WAK16_08755, partial [Candidatus Cybelea sp.]